MEVQDLEAVTEFKLLEGTVDAFAFKWPTGRFPIGKFTTTVDGMLLDRLLPGFANNPQGRDFVFLIHGIRLGWCYTAMEAERARIESAELRARVEALESALATLLATLRVDEGIR